MYRHSTGLLAILSVILSCSPKNEIATEEWIRKNAFEIKSIDPLDEDFTDLAPLKESIGNTRIVLLGEAEHGDGSTFYLKSRIVKYLHQELGFNVVAFESSFFGINNSYDEFHQGKGNFQGVTSYLYGNWRRSAGCEELLRYIEYSTSSDNPLRLAGIDSRQVRDKTLLSALDSIFRDRGLINDQKEYTFLKTTLDSLLRQEYQHQISKVDRGRFIEILKKYELELSETNVDKFWIQELKNTMGYALHSWNYIVDEENGYYNGSFRDKQMADNLVWLLNEKYSGEKIIVWAANGHLIKNFSEIDSLTYSPEEIKARGLEHSMGEYLKDDNQNFYSLITVSYAGQGADFNFKPYNYEPADENSVEGLFHKAGFKYAFMDVKGNGGSWLNEDRRIRIFRSGYSKINLRSTCDGILFIDQMIANQRIAD